MNNELLAAILIFITVFFGVVVTAKNEAMHDKCTAIAGIRG